jgi:hypothetical protein
LNVDLDYASVRGSAAQLTANSSTRPKEFDMEMHKVDIGRLEKSIGGVRERLDVLAQGDDFEELIKIIRRPGWTTPAEFRLVHGIVETIGRQVAVIEHLKTELLESSRLVSAEGVRTKA